MQDLIPACRAATPDRRQPQCRHVGHQYGLIERWECLEDATGSGAVDAGTASRGTTITGSATYRSFSYVPGLPALADGAHVLRLGIESKGVVISATRSYDHPVHAGPFLDLAEEPDDPV